MFIIVSLFCCVARAEESSEIKSIPDQTFSIEYSGSSSTSTGTLSYESDSLYLNYSRSAFNDITGSPVNENNILADLIVSTNQNRDWSLGFGFDNIPENSIRIYNFSVSTVRKTNDESKTKWTFAYEAGWGVAPVPSSLSYPDDMIFQQNKLTLGWSRKLTEDWNLSLSANGYLYDRNLMNYLRSYTLIGLVTKSGRLMIDALNNLASWDVTGNLKWYLNDDYSLKLSSTFTRTALTQVESYSNTLTFNAEINDQYSVDLGTTSSFSLNYQATAPNYSSSITNSYFAQLNYHF